MRRLRNWFLWSLLLVCLLVAAVAAPVVYVETACTGKANHRPYVAMLPAGKHRAESRTLLTYPEWHIVHAYDDYGEVIRKGAPTILPI